MQLSRASVRCLATVAVFMSGLASAAACQGPKVMSPDRQCWAYYYKADFGVSFTTQAMMSCRYAGHIIGGGIVAYHDRLSSGIGFRWLSDRVLEVSLDPKARLGTDAINRPATGQAGDKQVEYRYRDLTPADQEWRGCDP